MSQHWRDIYQPQFEGQWENLQEIHFSGESQPFHKRKIPSTVADSVMPTVQDESVAGDNDMEREDGAAAEQTALVEADAGAVPAPPTPRAKRPRSNEGTPIKERPPIPGIPPEQQALAALLLESTAWVTATIRENESEIKRVEDESRRRHEANGAEQSSYRKGSVREQHEDQ